MARRPFTLETLLMALALAGLLALALWSRLPARRAAPGVLPDPTKPAADVTVPPVRPALPPELPAAEIGRLRKFMDYMTPEPPEKAAERQREQDRIDRMLAPKAETPASRAEPRSAPAPAAPPEAAH